MINKIIKKLNPDKIPQKIVIEISSNIIDSQLANITNENITKCFFFSEGAKTVSVRSIF